MFAIAHDRTQAVQPTSQAGDSSVSCKAAGKLMFLFCSSGRAESRKNLTVALRLTSIVGRV